MDDVESVLDDARELVTPDPEERGALDHVAETLRERAEAVLADLQVDGEVVLVGSAARDTWLPGDRDVDVFVCFPPEFDRSDLETHGLEVGHAVVPDGREEYAEHPYVHGTIEDVDVDVVPCYDVPTAADVRSAVDRTPFHTEYVVERLDDDLATEVRLAKGFATAVGVYGSDLRTRGFSGYLLELLVVEYGDFRGLLEAAAGWHPQVEFDPADHATTDFEDPLVVIDPTDPGRNVAAVCSAANVARFQHHARQFLADPDVWYFETRSNARAELDAGVGAGTASSADTDGPARTTAFDAADLRDHLDRRDTTPIAVRVPAPDLVDDDLYPQMRTSLRGIVGRFDREGFDVLRSAIAVADGDALLLFELEVAERPAVERHVGPPVHVREHAERFYATYADDSDVYGPFVDGDRYVVERARTHTTAVDLLESDAIHDVAHGAAIERQLATGFDCLVGEELVDLLPAFAADLAAYFDPSP